MIREYRGTKYRILQSSPRNLYKENYCIEYLRKKTRKKYIFFGPKITTEEWEDFSESNYDSGGGYESKVCNSDKDELEKHFLRTLHHEWKEV